MTKQGDIVEIKRICNEKIIGTLINNREDVFDKPIQSSVLSIFKANVSHINSTYSEYSLYDVKSKLVGIAYQNYIYFFPLLHTL